MKMTKKKFKELCSFHEYGRGQNKRNAIYYGWKMTDDGIGYSHMVKTPVYYMLKKVLLGVFYHWVINDQQPVHWVKTRRAVTDSERFKASLMG